ncbi:MAG: FCD domain-containing protein [Alphaproteobacteria bacterium]|nr:FCD domain-containing protein [Alphaproteobacteria bacterium]
MMAKRDSALRHLRERIASGAYPETSQLPPERDLASEIGVSRGAVRRALAILEGEGRVWRHVGKGTFVGSRPVSSVGPTVFGSSLRSPAHVLEVRSILEPAIARLAARRASRVDIARIRSHLAASKAVSDTPTFNLHCELLHRAIARATHNAILLRLYDALNPIRTLAEAVGDVPPLTSVELGEYWQQHADVVDAIDSGDPGRAEAAMTRHITVVWTDTPPDDRAGASARARHDEARMPPALLVALFHDALETLAERVGETAFVAALSDGHVEVVDVVLPKGAGHACRHPGTGLRHPACCAAARAVLAMLDDGAVHALTETMDEHQAAGTADGARWPPLLAQVRADGYSRCADTGDPDTVTVAVPAGLGLGAAVGVIGARQRLETLTDTIVLAGLRRAAADVIRQAQHLMIPVGAAPQGVPRITSL